MFVAYYRAFTVNLISLQCVILSTLKVTQYSRPIKMQFIKPTSHLMLHHTQNDWWGTTLISYFYTTE